MGRKDKGVSPKRMADNPRMGQESLPLTDIDRKLLQHQHNRFETQIELFRIWKRENPREFNQLFAPAIITEKFSWEAGEPRLNEVYKEFNNQYFLCDEDDFRNVFLGQRSIVKKIKLLGPINELACTFGYFIDHKIVSFSTHPYLLLSECFVGKNNKPLKVETLRVLLETRVISSKRWEKLESILKKIFE